VAGTAVAGLNGFVPPLTSFVGRAGQVGEVAGLLDEYRLVTVTGPGGVGKTRLAGEVARRVASRFADGAWLVELAAVQEPALVPAAVAVALGIPQQPGVSIADSLAGVLARRQLLLVLDNCEHVAEAAAELCAALLPVADDVRVLATSREPVGVAGEVRYRLPPLSLPGLGRHGESGEDAGSEAVALFADRARQADAHFVLSVEASPVVAQLMARLDGMPLAIELAAARVESLGVAQLLDRLDDRFALLAGTDRAAAPRQRSLAATVDWSYQLLSEDERRVFRQLAIFPGPFTLEAAEAVAGVAAKSAVLHLVDCSLLTAPRTGPDGRVRYLMLETLRAYGLERLAGSGEHAAAATALAWYALQVAEEATSGLRTSAGELPAARWLDAEDATTQQALAWALEHDHAVALRLATALAPWWFLRGRAVAGYALLHTAAGHAAPGSDPWCAAQNLLGEAACLTDDMARALDHYTAVRDALATGPPSPTLIEALAGRSDSLLNRGHIPEGAEDARHALALAREIGYPQGEATALVLLSMAVYYTGDNEDAVEWARQACRIDPAAVTGHLARTCNFMLAIALSRVDDVNAVQRICADGLALATEAGDACNQGAFLELMADVERRAGCIPEAGAHLREALRLSVQTGDQITLHGCLDVGGHLCVATGRWAEAVTLWAAHAARVQSEGLPDLPQTTQRRQESLRKAGQALGPARMREAEERGAAMTLQTAVEFATMLTAQDPHTPQPPQSLAQLSAREQELVTLVAQGRTDAQIATQLYISVSTVRSHLERVRDKSGCRRRADLTRLALQAGLV
jgi:predicted ATPase/DNA-binding CsgD family transcriptional regulator